MCSYKILIFILIQAPSPHNIIESSNACASFCCALVNNQRDIFPLTIDEKPPKRLRFAIIKLIAY